MRMRPEDTSVSDAGRGAERVELVDPGELADADLEAWRALAVARENPFLTPEWSAAWREAAGEESRVAIWRDPTGAVRAAVPLSSAGRRPRRQLRFPGHRNGDWYGIACAEADQPEALAALLGAIAPGTGSCDLLRLERVSPELAASARQLAGSAAVALRPPDVLPFIELDDGFEGWLASRSRNFRSQLGRRRRRAEREHEVGFEAMPAPAELEERMATLFDLHDSRRRQVGAGGLLGAAERRAYTRFAAASLERGWLRLHELRLDGTAVAAWYGWRLGDRYCYGISGFDPRHSELAVGMILLAHTIEAAAAEGSRVYDMLWGDEAYKSRYETGRRTVESVAIVGAAGRLAIRAELAARAAGRRLPRALKARLR